ncbi:lambda exonuclease family protein [Salinisphaera sp.]|uniref:lambda exonuclease family protein n=1 Tax=Salinisphaera sp. TaxID=1914330 RepID=UPI000C5EC457|nr:lambda exonuclease family protein [Salinisphaera sp.]MAS09942.1 hypothetical protein [Salinisphaera sp.]
MSVGEQRSDIWFGQRLAALTGSQMKRALSKGKDARANLVNELVAEALTSNINPSGSAPATEWGKHYEPIAIGEYEFSTGNTVDEAGLLYHPYSAYIAASPDGLIGDDGGCEVKCPYSSKEHVNALRFGVPKEHYPQIMGALMVTRRQWWDFISYDPRMRPGLRLHVYRVEADASYIDTLEAAALSVADEVAETVEALQEAA